MLTGVQRRRQVIIRERLKFPSGFSTAVLISVLHGKTRKEATEGSSLVPEGGFASLVSYDNDSVTTSNNVNLNDSEEAAAPSQSQEDAESWRKNVQLLLVCFLVSGLFTFSTYFFPVLRNLPVFGSVAASTWLWTLNPSLAYVGQGIVMGPSTTLHMLLGAVVGWGILSPLATYKGWVKGPVDDWENGSKGWIVWTSLAIMLADSVVSLGYLTVRSISRYVPHLRKKLGALGRLPLPGLPGSAAATGRETGESRGGGFKYTTAAARNRKSRKQKTKAGYTAIDTHDHTTSAGPSRHRDADEASLTSTSTGTLASYEFDNDDAPAHQQISNRIVSIGLLLSIAFCIACIHIVFGDLVPLYATVTAVFMALVLSIMGVRALGETDLNPVSGISKLAQLFFAFIIPQGHKSSVLINLVAGAVSEAGALQAGDLMQDLKTGHLLGAAPKAQFWGQVIGASVGAVVSAFIYRLYTSVYTVPGDLFQVPTAYVWIFTARLVTGEGLPYMAKEWAMGAAALFSVTTVLRIALSGPRNENKKWQAIIPGGIAVAVGMYNVPSFTLARTVGGLLAWWWRGRMGWADTPLIVLASVRTSSHEQMTFRGGDDNDDVFC